MTKLRNPVLIAGILSFVLLLAFQNCNSGFRSNLAMKLISSSSSSSSFLARGDYILPNQTLVHSSGQGEFCRYSSVTDYVFAGGETSLSQVTSLAALPAGVQIEKTCDVPTPQSEAATNTICEECIGFHVEKPQIVFWPTPETSQLVIPDSLFTVVALPDHFVGFTTATFLTTSSTVLGLNQNSLSLSPVLKNGSPGQFDECGAWIQGADLAPETSGTTTIRAWYHGESEHCGVNNIPGHFKKSVGYAYSTDGGKSFIKPTNNLVLSAAPDELVRPMAGNGDHSVVSRGSFNYMFFSSVGALSGLAVANVKTSGPGNFIKWFEGKFSEPGIGGHFSDIGPLLAGVSYNTDLQRFFGMTYQNSLGVGFRVAVSPNAVSWKIIDAPLIPGGTVWGGTVKRFDDDVSGVFPNGYALYPTMIAPDGSKHWKDSFYLYYLYLRPQENFETRFGLVSRVTITVRAAPVPASQKVIVDLERYASPSTGTNWATTGPPIPKRGLWDFHTHDSGKLGGLFTKSGDGLIELSECVRGDADYFISVDISGNCEGTTKLRTAGWIFSPFLPQPSGTHPLYRCYRPTTDDHLMSTDKSCEDLQSRNEGLLGYAVN